MKKNGKPSDSINMRKLGYTFLFFLLTNCAGFITQTWKPPQEKHSVSEIRVLLGKESEKPIRITGEGILSVFDINDLLIKKSIDLVQVNPKVLKASIRIRSEKGVLGYNGVSYRGDILLHPQNEEILVINLVSLEQYLYSVVASEVLPDWHEEALKAQAICARTYAVRQMLRRSSDPYDLGATTSDQVYSGMSKENPRTTKAVDDTKGTILLYNSMPIEAFFHSNAGGYTEKPENVWSSSLPYLDHVESPFDMEAPNYSWEDRISPEKMNQYLASLGLGKIESIRVIRRNQSQRVDLLEVKGENGILNIKGKDFRRMVGESKVKSLKFGIKKEGESFYVKGLGSGHGVGMSQWGAAGKARNGSSYAKILSHYFPNTELAKILD